LVPTLLLVGILVFLLVHLLPGDPAPRCRSRCSPETVELVRLGLDLSLPRQFVRFVSGALRGDFGKSIRTKRQVASEIAERFAPTFWLTVWSMAWSVIIANRFFLPYGATVGRIAWG
jgi:glutathione transport system permease protein